MTWTVDASGTQTAVIGTEHILDSPTTNATYVLEVDTTNMVAGDVLELRVYNKTLTGSTLHQAWKGTYSNGQVNPVKKSVPIDVVFGAKFTLKQTLGTGRNFDWSVNRI